MLTYPEYRINSKFGLSATLGYLGSFNNELAAFSNLNLDDFDSFDPSVTFSSSGKYSVNKFPLLIGLNYYATFISEEVVPFIGGGLGVLLLSESIKIDKNVQDTSWSNTASMLSSQFRIGVELRLGGPIHFVAALNYLSGINIKGVQQLFTDPANASIFSGVSIIDFGLNTATLSLGVVYDFEGGGTVSRGRKPAAKRKAPARRPPARRPPPRRR